ESQYKLYRTFLDVLHIFLGMPDDLQMRRRSVEDGRLAERVLKDDMPDDPKMRRRSVEDGRLAERVLEDIIIRKSRSFVTIFIVLFLMYFPYP
ncbi:MAG: hypothetical protein WC871_05345, partial [Bacteroidales bacterium]